MLVIFLSTVFSILVAIALFASCAAKRKSIRPLNFPPGPKGLPFFGSVLEINTSEPWLTFMKWAPTYGACHAHTENYNSHTHFVSRRPNVLYFLRTTDPRHPDYGRRQSTT